MASPSLIPLSNHLPQTAVLLLTHYLPSYLLSDTSWSIIFTGPEATGVFFLFKLLLLKKKILQIDVFLVSIIFLATPIGMWDLSSLTGN